MTKRLLLTTMVVCLLSVYCTAQVKFFDMVETNTEIQTLKKSVDKSSKSVVKQFSNQNVAEANDVIRNIMAKLRRFNRISQNAESTMDVITMRTGKTESEYEEFLRNDLKNNHCYFELSQDNYEEFNELLESLDMNTDLVRKANIEKKEGLILYRKISTDLEKISALISQSMVVLK